MWWKDKRSVIIKLLLNHFLSHTVPSLLFGQWNRVEKKEKKENGHSGVKVSDTTSDFLLLWHCIVQRFEVVLHDTVKKMVCESPASEVLTTLNHLLVTGSSNFGSTWANGDHDLAPNKMVINSNVYPVLGELFDAPSRSRSNFRFWKRKWRHPRWRAEAEVAPAPW